MEMRAREDLPMARDLIPSLPAAAAALHDPFLSSHCSACFRPLSNYQTTPPFSCSACASAVLYCSPLCRRSDSDLHSSSGECLLLLLTQPSSATWHDTSDVRAALRLLSAFGTLGRSPRRIGWLSSANLDAVLGESGSEMGERIRQGAELMRRVRRKEGAREEEEEALWAVLTNAVEVQVSEGGALGIAVYGPLFSWFNHSCLPNACYRFELADAAAAASDSCDLGLAKVQPASEEEEAEVVSL